MLSSRAAAKLPGAPSRTAIDKYFAKAEPPAWAVKTPEGWRVDESAPAWQEYIRGRTATVLPLVAAPDRPLTYAQAKAEGEAIKNDILRLKLRREEGRYVDAERMRYYFGFIPRAFADGIAAIRKLSPDLERLYKAGDAKEAEKMMMAELRRVHFAVFDALQDEIKKDENTREGP